MGVQRKLQKVAKKLFYIKGGTQELKKLQKIKWLTRFSPRLEKFLYNTIMIKKIISFIWRER